MVFIPEDWLKYTNKQQNIYRIFTMLKEVKIYKPSDEEILRNVVQSFEIENIYFSYEKAKIVFLKVLGKIKRANG